jgi:hypothetical protein
MDSNVLLAPVFVHLYVLTGECIDPAGVNAIAPRVPEEVKREHASQIQRVIQGEGPDYLPFSADLRWWFAEHWHAGTLDRALEGVDLDCLGLRGRGGRRQRLYEVGFDPDSGIETRVEWSGEPIRYVRGGYPGTLRAFEIVTPLGTLRTVEKYAHYTFGIIEYLIKSVEDLRIYRYFLEHCRVKRLPVDAGAGPAGVSGPKTPMQAFIVELAGIINTAYLMMDARDEMEQTMELMAHLENEIYSIVVDSDASVVMICENLSADNSAGYWDQYIGPQLAEWADLLHSHGKKLFIHQDGKLRPLLARLQDVGVDLVNGITAAPSGDVRIEDLREMAGDQIVLQDILPQSIFTPTFSDAEFEAYIRNALLCLKNDDRVILGIGDMLPLDGSIKRVETLVKMARELTAR